MATPPPTDAGSPRDPSSFLIVAEKNKRRRTGSRQSPDLASADRSGEAASADRSGEAASAAADRNGGGVEGGRQQRSEEADPLPARRAIPSGALEDSSFGEDTALAPEHLHNLDGDEQATEGASATLSREKENIKDVQLYGRHLGSLDDSQLLMGPSSADEKANTWLKVEKEHPKPSSGDLGEISKVEDGRSNKKLSSEDLDKLIAQDEDEQRSGKTSDSAIDEGQSHGLGGAGWRAQALLDLDDDSISAQISSSFQQLNFDPAVHHDYCSEYTSQQQTKLYERLALYRIRGYKLLVEMQSTELDDANLNLIYPPGTLCHEGYFRYYEKSLDWYFDPELCKNSCFDDYQRLVLRDNGEYQDWVRCQSNRNTYEEDMSYVQYCEALANETKWINDHQVHIRHQWNKVRNVALLQALKIAAPFHNVSSLLVSTGFYEHLWSTQFDRSNYEGLDDVYFEIWKRVTKLSMKFTDALLELHHQNMFPLRSFDIEHELKNTPLRFSLKDNYDTYVSCIDETVSEGEVRQLIKEAVIKMSPKPKIYLDYAKKKLDVAEYIGLIPKGQRGRQLGGDKEAKLAMDG